MAFKILLAMNIIISRALKKRRETDPIHVGNGMF